MEKIEIARLLAKEITDILQDAKTSKLEFTIAQDDLGTREDAKCDFETELHKGWVSVLVRRYPKVKS